MIRRNTILLIAILVVAFAARLVFAGFVVGFHADTKGDATDYHLLGKHLASGDGYATVVGKPTGRRPPGLPFVLAGVYSVVGPNQAYARVLQVFLGVLVVWLVFLLGRRCFGETAGLLAAAFCAINPFLTFISGFVLTENLYMSCMLGAFLLALTPDELMGGWRRSLAAIVLLVMATITRPTGMPLVIWVIACLVVFARAPWRTRLVRAAVVSGVVLVLVLPWCFRNQAVFGGWVGLTTHGGITFFQGNNPKVISIPDYRGGVAPLAALPRFAEWSRMSELDRDRFAWRLGREFVMVRWRDMPKVTWWKFQRFWRLKSDVGLSGIKSGWWFNRNTLLGRVAAEFDAGLIYASVAFPLFILGMWWTRRRWRDLLFLYGVVIVHTMIGLLFFGSIRGRIPIEPVIAIFASYDLIKLVGAVRERVSGAGRPGSAQDPAGT